MEHFLNHYQVEQELKRTCADNISLAVRRQIEEMKKRLPKLIFIESFSTEYHCPSQDDLLLQVIYYDTDYHKLSAAYIQFATVEFDAAWPAVNPLCKPEVLEVEDLPWEDWLRFSDTIFVILGQLRRNLALNKPSPPPKHKVTDHSLVPVFEILANRR